MPCAFNRSVGRTYGVWVWANLRRVPVRGGPGPGGARSDGCGLAWRPSGTRRAWLSAPIVASSVGLFAVLFTIDLLGINRGEITRLWIFLACFFQLPAAYVCATLNHRAAIAAVLGITLLQDCFAIGTIGFVVP